MDDLFANLPEVKSPRLLWMEKHGITTEKRVSSLGAVYVATATSSCGKYNISTKATTNDHDAIVDMAIKLEIKLWNQL